MLGDLDMVVEADPTSFPLGVLVRAGWQRYERRSVELFVKGAPADAPAAHQAIVEIVEQRTNCRIEFGQREEAAVPQPRQYPTPDHLHPDLDFSFVTRLVGARRNDGGAVMPRHVGIGPIDRRLVKAGLDDPGLQIVADGLPGGAGEIGEGADMRGDPIRQLLAPHRLGVGEARGTQDGDKNLHRDDLAGEAVDDLGGPAGEVNK